MSIADAMRHGGSIASSTRRSAEFKDDGKHARNTHSAVFAEVKVDEQLGVIRVTRVVNAVAAGRILNTKTAHSQIMGSVVWGIGMALHEETLVDHRFGRIMNANIAEYHVPVNADVHDIKVIFVDEPDDIINPLGIKGVGEIGIVGVAAAIANAVYHATGKARARPADHARQAAAVTRRLSCASFISATSRPFRARPATAIVLGGGTAMKIPRRKLLRLAAGAAVLPAVSRVARAQSLSGAAGAPRSSALRPAGATDILARLIGQWLSERLGQPFVIENRPGAGSNIGTEAVVRAPADGHTLLLVAPANAINATLYDRLNFNFIRDIAPVAGLIRVANVMEVNPSVPAKTLPEFIAYAKANPGKINYGVGRQRQPAARRRRAVQDDGRHRHGARALSRRRARADRSARRAGAALLRHHGVDHRATSGAGKLRALAVTTATRSPALPDVPTVGEFVPGYEASSWYGIGAPMGTPAEIVDRLNREINAGLADPKIKARLADMGGTALTGPPAEFGKLIADETEKWGKVVKFSGAKPE